MRKRRIYQGVLLLVAVGVIGLFVGLSSGEREPEYGGKKLSEWVEEYGRGRRSPFDADPYPIGPVRRIGTNAVPYLLKWMRYEAPPWKEKLYKTINPIILRINRRWWLSDAEEARVRGAVWALGVLEPKPETVVGEFEKMLNHPKRPLSASRAATALFKLGEPGLRPLLACSTNLAADPSLRSSIVRRLGLFPKGPWADSIFPRLLSDSDPNVRTAASNAIWILDRNEIK